MQTMLYCKLYNKAMLKHFLDTLKEAGSVKMIPKRLRYLLDFGYMNIWQDFKILIWSNYEHKVYFFFKSDKIRVSAWTIWKVINQLMHLILSIN